MQPLGAEAVSAWPRVVKRRLGREGSESAREKNMRPGEALQRCEWDEGRRQR